MHSGDRRTERQTDEEIDSRNAPRCSRCRERRLPEIHPPYTVHVYWSLQFIYTRKIFDVLLRDYRTLILRTGISVEKKLTINSLQSKDLILHFKHSSSTG